jgi:Tol biopolymer transport system component
VLAAAACGPLDPLASESGGTSTPIVTTERGPRGGRLVFVSERGVRMAELTRTEIEPTIDTAPEWSPDGKWIVFASSRGRSELEQTSLWVVPAHSRARPRRLTGERAVDRDPAWTADGKAVVFASNAAGSFDLWRAPLRSGKDGWPELDGEGDRLTTDALDELSPTTSPDGRTIVYMRLDRATQRSELWSLPARGGSPRQLTRGPADLTPSISPDGARIAFAAPVGTGTRRDTDLYLIAMDGSGRRRVLDEPYSDETGPAWSPDARWLFATAVFRSRQGGSPILASLIAIDLRERKRVARALHDPVAVESRIGVAIAPRGVNAPELRANEIYFDALRRAVSTHVKRLFDEYQQEHRRK